MLKLESKLIKISKQIYLLNFFSKKDEIKFSILRELFLSHLFLFRRIFLKKKSLSERPNKLIVCSNDYQVKKGEYISKKLMEIGIDTVLISQENVYQSIKDTRLLFFAKLYFHWVIFFSRVCKSYIARKSNMKVMLLKNSMRYFFNLLCAKSILNPSTKVLSIDPSDPFSRSFIYARDNAFDKVIVAPFGFPTKNEKEIPIDSSIHYVAPGNYSCEIIKQRSKSQKVDILGDIFGLGNIFNSNPNSESLLFISAPHMTTKIGGTNGQLSKLQYQETLMKLVAEKPKDKKLKVRPHPVDNNLNYLKKLESQALIEIDYSEKIDSDFLVGFSSTVFFDALMVNIPYVCLINGEDNDLFSLKKKGYPYVFNFNLSLKNIFNVNRDYNFQDFAKKYIKYSNKDSIIALGQMLNK